MLKQLIWTANSLEKTWKLLQVETSSEDFSVSCQIKTSTRCPDWHKHPKQTQQEVLKILPALECHLPLNQL